MAGVPPPEMPHQIFDQNADQHPRVIRTRRHRILYGRGDSEAPSSVPVSVNLWENLWDSSVLVNSWDRSDGDHNTIQAHSTISKDETGGMEAIERNLLAILATKYNYSQSFSKPEENIDPEKDIDLSGLWIKHQRKAGRTSSNTHQTLDLSPPKRPGFIRNSEEEEEEAISRKAQMDDYQEPEEFEAQSRARIQRAAAPPQPELIKTRRGFLTESNLQDNLPSKQPHTITNQSVDYATTLPLSPIINQTRFLENISRNPDHDNITGPFAENRSQEMLRRCSDQACMNNQFGCLQRELEQGNASTMACQPFQRVGAASISSTPSRLQFVWGNEATRPDSPHSVFSQENTSAYQHSLRSKHMQDSHEEKARHVSMTQTPDNSGWETCHHSDTYPELNNETLRQSNNDRPKVTNSHIFQHHDQINWRSKLCEIFQIPSKISDEILLSTLCSNAEEFRIACKSFSKQDLSGPYHTIHRVFCAEEDGYVLYLDTPWAVNSKEGTIHLRGSTGIDNLELHIERHKSLAFLVYNDYSCCSPNPARSSHSAKQNREEDVHGINKYKSGESVCVISEQFSSALTEIRNENLDVSGYYSRSFDVFDEFPAPYLWLYHQREFIGKIWPNLSRPSQHCLGAFLQYIDKTFGEEYDEVDNLVGKGLISWKYMPYLFLSDGLKLNASTWTYDGFFESQNVTLYLECESTLTQLVKIVDLKFFPISYANPLVKKQLRKEGEIFWACRKRNYVCYLEDRLTQETNSGDPRFMIDISIHKKMHPDSSFYKRPNIDALGPVAMTSETPPAGNFTLLLPNRLAGFNMQEKKWVELEVGRISPVKWNKGAFESLVADDHTKILIEALVRNKIAAGQSTDLMSGKGNGLIVLLHGGPGTGKTLTAESVAEIAEKPLYRVTCGDIGTDPEAVEKYLETVLYLGKVWECVVLLDEADVFLEQRTLADLQRNALVSVFLRVLEYYDEILVLTSNRVGTFDEAFKSRIQLSLRYENLTEPQRYKIWENFINRLETFETSPQPPNNQEAYPNSSSFSQSVHLNPMIDIPDLRKHLPALAKYKMNGRQIRNAVTTARQLALFKQTPMGHEHLEHVIGVASKFDEYLLEVHENLDGDAIARDSGDR